MIDASGTPEQTQERCRAGLQGTNDQGDGASHHDIRAGGARDIRGATGRQLARLEPGIACDTAFRIIARRHLDAVIAQHVRNVQRRSRRAA